MRFVKRVRRFIFGVILLIACAGAFVAYDTWRSSKQSEQPSAPTGQTNSTFASSFEVYRTEYFQFQAGKTWSAVTNESTANKFVYRKFNDALVEAQLTIYVNEPADQGIDANRVLPVTFGTASNKLDAIFVSDHCAKDVGRGYKTMVLLGVTFRCNTDTTDYSVLVGKEGGTTLLNMLRPNGSPITYVIYFRDLRAIASPQDIVAIMDTFQTR